MLKLEEGAAFDGDGFEDELIAEQVAVGGGLGGVVGAAVGVGDAVRDGDGLETVLVAVEDVVDVVEV